MNKLETCTINAPSSEKVNQATKTETKTPIFPRFSSKHNRRPFITFSNAAIIYELLKAACLSFHA